MKRLAALGAKLRTLWILMLARGTFHRAMLPSIAHENTPQKPQKPVVICNFDVQELRNERTTSLIAYRPGGCRLNQRAALIAPAANTRRSKAS